LDADFVIFNKKV